MQMSNEAAPDPAMLAGMDPITRDVYTPELWRRLGWTILRVTPGMWLEERDEVIERIEGHVRAGA
jgi:hypothetical protein